MKQFLKQFSAFAMALLVLWAGNGYGVLEHSCETHGKHQHILSNWVETSCEHEHHHDSESHDSEQVTVSGSQVFSDHEHHYDSETHQHVDVGFEASHSDEQVNFVHFYAETESKVLVSSSAFIQLFQITVPPSFAFQTVVFPSAIHSSFSLNPFFRRTFGRSLLAFVQSFLI